MKNVILSILIIICANIQSNAKYQWAPISSIFDKIPVRINESIPAAEIEDGYYYMLIDKQFDIKTHQKYVHYAYKVISESGIQNYSELSVNYNPAYETVDLNSIRIYRNGKYFDYKSKVSIKDIQREDGLENHIYNEEHTLYIILENIEINDIIEFSYTIKGVNPIFADYFQESFSYQLGYTLLDYYIKIRKPTSYLLSIQNNNTTEKYTTKNIGNEEEYIWTISNIEREKKSESDVPSWVKSNKSIEIASSQTWEVIRKWGINIFSVNKNLNQNIKSWCKKLKEEDKNTEDKIIQLLRFVQSKIRYFGIEVGVNSHKPHSPDETVKQGYGDCKDKTILLITLLNEIGITTAFPALVSTEYKEHVSDYLPSPFLFDHAIVYVEYNNKKYWLDPTVSNQKGDLQHTYTEPYGKALILAGSNHELDSVIVDNIYGTEITEFFEVNDYQKATLLEVTTKYKGINADEFRYTLQNNSINSIQEDYLNFYKKIYEQVDTINLLTYKDDTISNEIILKEFYIISQFWNKADSSKKVFESNLFTHSVYEKIRYYKDKYLNRKNPLYLEFPLEITHRIIASLPKNWSIEQEDYKINSNYFEFDYSKKFLNNELTIKIFYKTLKDYISTDEIPRFIRDINIIKNYTNVNLKTGIRENNKNTFQYWGLLVFILLVLMLAFYYFKLYEKKSLTIESSLTIDTEHNYERIGGLIILPLIGLAVSPLVIFTNVIVSGCFTNSYWICSSNYCTLESILKASLFLINIFFVVTPMFLLLIAFNRKKIFLQYIIYFYGILLACKIYSFYITNAYPDIFIKENISELIKQIFVSVVWLPYFMYSKKCKRIFVN